MSANEQNWIISTDDRVRVRYNGEIVVDVEAGDDAAVWNLCDQLATAKAELTTLREQRDVLLEAAQAALVEINELELNDECSRGCVPLPDLIQELTDAISACIPTEAKP